VPGKKSSNIRSGATLFSQGDNSIGPIRSKIIFDTGIYDYESENHTEEQKEEGSVE